MLLSTFFLILGFVLLIYSADKFTNNSIKIAHIFNISPLIIGLLIFGFGTSAPELLISAISAYDDNIDISAGNALGSNIINIALVLGISAVIAPVKVSAGILKKEWLLLITATIVSYLLLLDNHISFIDGMVLLLLLPLLLFISIRGGKKNNNILEIPKDNHDKEQENKSNNNKSGANPTYIIWLKLVISMIVLIIGAKTVVWSGTSLARQLGISDLIIGLTIIAFGTSLPELAISIMASIKRQHDMIIGNIIGSNLFNTLAVLAMPGLIAPNYINSELLTRDYPAVFALTVLLFLVSYKFGREHIINRFEGLILVLVGGYYISLLMG